MMKFLVIDDHVLIRQAMQGVLKKLRRDSITLEAANYHEASKAMMEHPDIGLVLLDLTLPDRDGFSVLEEMHKTYPATPVVVLSAVQDATNVHRALEMGALGYIPKSAQGDVLLNALRLVMSGGIYVPPEILVRETIAKPGTNETELMRVTFHVVGIHLTDRQFEVLSLIMQGKNNKIICRTLGLSTSTVKNHVTAILKELKVTNRTEAVIAANQLGWKATKSARSSKD